MFKVYDVWFMLAANEIEVMWVFGYGEGYYMCLFYWFVFFHVYLIG